VATRLSDADRLVVKASIVDHMKICINEQPVALAAPSEQYVDCSSCDVGDMYICVIQTTSAMCQTMSGSQHRRTTIKINKLVSS